MVVDLKLDTNFGSGPSKSKQVHAIFLCHGLWGEPRHMHSLRDALQNRAQTRGQILRIHCCESYTGVKTYDGVDICADRVVDEIYSRIEIYRKVSEEVYKFSILGYSLGGLIARLVVYKLDKQDFFSRIRPCNFTTFASPALGVPITPGAASSLMRSVASFFLSRTGKHLYLQDKDGHSGEPLLRRLASGECLVAINKFDQIDVYANAVLDRVVPYLSGGIDNSDPFMPALAKTGVFRDKEFDPQTVVIGNMKLTLDSQYQGVITRVEKCPVPTRDQSGSWEKPTLWMSIKPWFSHSTYPFLPFPLAIALIILIPTIIPPIILVLGSFAFQRISSSIRVRKHQHSDPSRSTDGLKTKSPANLDLESQVIHPPKNQSGDSYQPSTFLSDTSAIVSPTRDPVLSPVAIPEIDLDLSGIHVEDSLSSRPTLHGAQESMAKDLNTGLSRMRKHITFFPRVFTSHKVIVCQDSSIAEHRRGLDVVRHWADHFAL